MRMRTATCPPFLSIGVLVIARLLVPLVLLLLLFLAFLGPFLGALAMAGADLGLLERGTGLEGAHLAQAGHHLDPLPDAHLSHLPHQSPDLLELVEELLDVRRLRAAASRDATAPAHIDDI